jgi:hypothetical protein
LPLALGSAVIVEAGVIRIALLVDAFDWDVVVVGVVDA